MNHMNVYRAFKHHNLKSYKLIVYAENVTIAKEIGDAVLQDCGIADVPDSNIIYGVYESYFLGYGGERGYMDTSSINYQEFAYNQVHNFPFVRYSTRTEKINNII